MTEQEETKCDTCTSLMIDIDVDSPQNLVQLFQCIDSNGDGEITKSELKNYMRLNSANILEHSPGIELSREILERIYTEADRNNDGHLDFSEFVSMMRNPMNLQWFRKHMARFNKHLVKLIPHEKDYAEYGQCRPPPVSILVISVIQVIIFCVDDSEHSIQRYLYFDPYKKAEIWRYFTYIFIHSDISHLVTNLVIQVALGVSLEHVNKWWRILVLYIFGAIFSMLVSGVFCDTLIVGASGAAFSLLTAHISVVILNYADMSFPLSQLFLFAMFTIWEICRSFGVLISRKQTDIAFVTHLGGMAAGLFMGIIILRNINPHKFELRLRYCCMVTLFVGCVVAGLLNVEELQWWKSKSITLKLM